MSNYSRFNLEPRNKLPSAPPILSYPDNGDELCERVFGYTPKPEQRKVAEHIGRGEDCILIAGCGWGKTLAYFLPLILWEKRIIVIISPLVALMEEQHQKLDALGISSIPIYSGRQLPDNLEEELIGGVYRAVFMSPETAFNDVRFGLLWSEDGWRSRVQAVVVDEAHCISTWGPEFRPQYSRIGDLRSKVPPGVAFVAVSATLHGQILEDVKESLRYAGDVIVIKADTDRPNIKYEVQMCYNNDTLYPGLEFLLDFKKTIVYFDKLDEMNKAYSYLARKALAFQPPRHELIGCYFADLATDTKQLYMAQFRRGEIRVLLSTEAAGMGCDMSDIVRVVQFRLPKNITVLAQRLGRAARDPSLQGSGILIYPRTDTHRLKTMDADLQDWVHWGNCRRKSFNDAFGNEHKTIPDCCDRCDLSLPASGKASDQRTSIPVPRRPAPTFKRLRRPEQQLEAKTRIQSWRNTELQGLRRHADFYTARCIMDDKFINLLSTRFGDVTTAEDISDIIYWSELVQGSQQRLADMLAEYNNEIDNPVMADMQLQNQDRQHADAQHDHEGTSVSLAIQQENITEKRAMDSSLLAFDTSLSKRLRSRK